MDPPTAAPMLRVMVVTSATTPVTKQNQSASSARPPRRPLKATGPSRTRVSYQAQSVPSVSAPIAAAVTIR